MIQEKYRLKKPKYNKLQQLGYRKCPSCLDAMSNRFPVYKYRKMATLFGEVIVDMNTGNISINCLQNSGEYYHPYYDLTYGAYGPYQDQIHVLIRNELSRIGAVEVKSKKTRKKENT